MQSSTCTAVHVHVLHVHVHVRRANQYSLFQSPQRAKPKNQGQQVSLRCWLDVSDFRHTVVQRSSARAPGKMSSVQLRVLFSYTASEQDECNLNEGDVVEFLFNV